MQPTTPPKSSSSALRRYGPIIGIVVVIAVIAAVVLVNHKSSSSTASGPSTTAAATGGYHPADVVSWTQAKADGTTKSINWGSRCDTTRGTLKYPSFFAGDCYKPFTGNNGGSTYQGVTSDSIKVVLYQSEANDPVLGAIEGSISDTDTNQQTVDTVKGWLTIFQTYYETYGRKVDLVPYVATGAATDDVAAKADAATIAAMKPFAVLGGPILTAAFGQAIIADKIFCLNCIPAQPQAFYAQHSPYVVSLPIGTDQGQVHVAEYIGKQLANRDAQFAGDSAMHNQKRKFGLVYISTGQDAVTQEKHFEQSLAQYNVHLAKALAYTFPIDPNAAAIVAQLKSAGVTSVIMTVDPVAPGALLKAATSQNYHPEWVLSGSALTDTEIFARTYDQDQWKHAFGVSFLAARTDPSVSGYTYIYKWFYGHAPPAQTGAVTTVPLFNLLYSVLQGVGPSLTPQHIQDALFSAPATPEALTQPSISFGNKHIWPYTDYLGSDDATEVWWNPNASGPDELNNQGKGMYEFVDGGKRYLPGHWPSGAPDVFDTKGAVALYTTVPKSEQVPQYPSPAKNN
jgi:Periplasmic binding protein